MSENTKKRNASTPPGGPRKDNRTDGGNISPAVSTSNPFSVLNHPSSYAEIAMRRSSVSSQGSAGRGKITNMGDRSFFVTPRPDGGMRDDLIVQCQTINGKPFKGTVTFKEAKHEIFQGKLGYEQTLLHSIRTTFNGCPVIKFKLKSQINIDDLASVEHFDFERRYFIGKEPRTDIIHCRVMGIRSMQSVANFDSSENDVRWVKIEGCEYTLEDQQILDWLRLYGDPISPICEDIHEDSDSDAEPIGNGTYSVKMKLNRDIPQFLPMFGRRIRIYYKGITKLCTQCFGSHNRRQCQNEKVPWVIYVRNYMFNNKNVEEPLFGKWWDIVEKEFPGYFDSPVDCGSNERNPTSHQTLPATQKPDDTSEACHTTEREPPPKLPRPSRDPRLLSRQTQQPSQQPQQSSGNDTTRSQEQVELTELVSRGLSLEDAKSYRKNKLEQANLEMRMQAVMSTNLQSSAETTKQVNRRGRGRGRDQSQQF